MDVDPLVREFTDGVLDLLGGAARLFAAADTDIAISDGPSGTPPVVTGTGALAAVATTAVSDYQRQCALLAESDADLRAIAAEATQVARRGADAVARLHETARTQAEALSPGATDSSAGIRVLVSSLGGHVEALQGHLDEAQAANAAVAERLRRAGDGYRQFGSPPA